MKKNFLLFLFLFFLIFIFDIVEKSSPFFFEKNLKIDDFIHTKINNYWNQKIIAKNDSFEEISNKKNNDSLKNLCKTLPVKQWFRRLYPLKKKCLLLVFDNSILLEDFNEAKKAIQELLIFEPQNLNFVLKHSQVFSKQQKNKQALKIIEEGLSIYPDSFSLLEEKISLLFALERSSEIIQIANRIKQETPMSVESGLFFVSADKTFIPYQNSTTIKEILFLNEFINYEISLKTSPYFSRLKETNYIRIDTMIHMGEVEIESLQFFEENKKIFEIKDFDNSELHKLKLLKHNRFASFKIHPYLIKELNFDVSSATKAVLRMKHKKIFSEHVGDDRQF